MKTADAAFTGSVPQLYESHLVPLIFEFYAEDLAARAKVLGAKDVLELAAGTGVVTRRLATALPGAKIVATDLNQAMLDEAAKVGTQRPVEFRQADAMQLPFPDASFDLVVCQYGVMFFPDKAKAHAEVHRVLRPGGAFLFNVWDRLEVNELAHEVTQAMRRMFPQDPPQFLARTPYAYNDPATLAADLRRGGFAQPPAIETVAARSRAALPDIPAIAFCQGTPLRGEIEARDATRLLAATQAATEALSRRFGRGPVEAGMQALVVTVRR